MLFNTLANLRTLIQIDPPRAVAMLDRLNDYLRATLRGSRTDARTGAHTLNDEFSRLSDYLELMAVRMGPRLRCRFDAPATCGATQCRHCCCSRWSKMRFATARNPASKAGRSP